MTSAKDIISLVNDYQNIGTADNVHLEAWKKEYPWFGSLYLLEAKSLKNENKFGFKKAIKTASLYAGDRSVLYDFINDQLAIKPSESIVTESQKEDKEEVIVEEVSQEPEVVETESVVEEKVEPTIEVKTEETIPPVKEPEVVLEEDITEETSLEDVPTSEPEIKEVKPTIIYDPLVALQDKVIPDKKPPKKVSTYDPLVELPKLEKPKPKKDKQDFYSWLDSLKGEEVVEPPKPRKLKMSAEASELLENFIKNRPTISKIRKDVDRLEIYQPSKETSDSKIVTESLAQLHIKQGKPELAIEIYETLGLQNPQKFSYFAALIEKIKKEHNLE